MRTQTGMGGRSPSFDEHEFAEDARQRREQANHQTSHLHRLPPELRNRIYELVLPAGDIVDPVALRTYFHRPHGKNQIYMGQFAMWKEPSDMSGSEFGEDIEKGVKKDDGEDDGEEEHESVREGRGEAANETASEAECYSKTPSDIESLYHAHAGLSILQVCQLIRSEASRYYYGSNEFLLHTLWDTYVVDGITIFESSEEAKWLRSLSREALAIMRPINLIFQRRCPEDDIRIWSGLRLQLIDLTTEPLEVTDHSHTPFHLSVHWRQYCEGCEDLWQDQLEDARTRKEYRNYTANWSISVVTGEAVVGLISRFRPGRSAVEDS